MGNEDKQLEDMIEVDDSALSLKEIEYIATNEKVRMRYEKKYKNTLYSKILMSLTHNSYAERDAAYLWDEIMAHRTRLNQMLNRDVGVSVATLDYLTNIKKSLSEPKIIEQDKSSFVSRATTTDELTGLYLRDVFDVMLKKEIDEAKRKDTPLCLLMIDIDDFKLVNDRYGHLSGDQVLSRVGACINDAVREMDLAARYGGEELVVIMPDTELEQAFKIAERIRKLIKGLSFKGFGVTVSIGVSMMDLLKGTPDALTASADQALYQAKRNGKNQVQVAESSGAGG